MYRYSVDITDMVIPLPLRFWRLSGLDLVGFYIEYIVLLKKAM